MLSALLRPFKGITSQAERSPDPEQDFASRPSVAEYRRHLHATADFTEADDDDDDEEESNDGDRSRYPTEGRPVEDEDGLARSTGLLPVFTGNQLDTLPIYSMTHAIRVIVQARTETTLSWEQLRSPQVSQFLVKPMLQQIRTQHFCRGTLYALLANCLQFEKEGQLYPGNAGTSATRAKVCELLAVKLLKEYTTRELIDALCYDFYPLQGIPGSQTPLAPGGRPKPATLRTSALEVAIRASAKQFLSHPLVTQQLEAIWNGAISFSSPREEPQHQGSVPSAAGSNQSRRQSTIRTPLLGEQRAKEEPVRSQSFAAGRRPVTLYNPRTTSLFRLSRLRVPRYRRLFSTCSLIILISLFLAVLGQRSSKITTLELVFWFWSAGFMLDELVGFNEEGFSFYAMSFWNIFDLGILLLLIVYYCMRIYGVFLLDPHQWYQNAYDVLAVNAILLLPRIFGVLDHYRNFSRLLISLRLLAVDLAAVFILIVICFSGFFVFFASSKSQDDAPEVAFKMFQVLMGFTSSAWELWPSYGWMGKALMGLFLVISHFMVITLLITVLANSFMSIASRASQEYQFNFAINTISMAKNDALFSYVAPGNIFAWALMPLRYCMSMEQYVRFNRVVIKTTHFPLLLCIFCYEKLFLAPEMYEATDLVDKPRGRQHAFSDPGVFSPSARVREESVVGYQKDQALEEVFRRVPDMRSQRRTERRKTQTAIRSWMDQYDGGGLISPQNYSTIDSRMGSDWLRRLSMNRERPSRIPKHYSDIRSTASDPADFISDAPYPMAPAIYDDGIARRDYAVEVKENTDGDADGDDELVTNDEDEGDDMTNAMDDLGPVREDAIDEDYFTTPVAARFAPAELSVDSPRPTTSRRIPLHTRTLSTNTILYAPEDSQPYSSSSASGGPFSRPLSTRHTPIATPLTPGAGRRSPRRALYLASRPRSMIQQSTAPHRSTGGLTLDIPNSGFANGVPPPRRRSLADLLETTTTAADADANHENARETLSQDDARSNGTDVDRRMLARMQSLEASLGHMVREMRTLTSAAPAGGGGGGRRRKSVPGLAAWNSDEGVVGAANAVNAGGGGVGVGVGTAGARSWGRYHQPHAQHHHHSHPREQLQQQQYQQHMERGRVVVGSDPSSVSGLALIEVAGRERERDAVREREGERLISGSKRVRGVVGSGGGGGGGGGGNSPAVATPSPRRSATMTPGRRTAGVWRSPRGEGPAAGLGIKGAVREKGKEKERGRASLSPRTEMGMSPLGRDDESVSTKGISL
ncbi:uncharacterized protein B0H64DRAFT_197170 [Chaetomium fimeti]|uniref:Ion transport domain-containing protein n=1 Tax=Chaetomium fimeti TaxID=1854472 RepID=A0AAE0LRJ5_9PEZI|nr:hypothetical protein B0H64DRAFT_197170 [Chaetomium fimeti]